MTEASHTERPSTSVARLASTTSPILALPPGWLAKYQVENSFRAAAHNNDVELLA